MLYRGAVLSVSVDRKTIEIKTTGPERVAAKVFGKMCEIGSQGIQIALPPSRGG